MGDGEKESFGDKIKGQDAKDEAAFKEHLDEAKEKGTYKGGPVMERGCTDIPCCCIFIAFIAALVGASAYGYKNGDPYKLLIGWDSNALVDDNGLPVWV